MINPYWLEHPISRTNFHGPKAVRAIEVRLYFKSNIALVLLLASETLTVLVSKQQFLSHIPASKPRSACTFTQDDKGFPLIK